MIRQTENLTEQDKAVFLNGIRKYMDRGIPVYMDGKRTDEKRLRRLFEPQGKFFYMADFVIEETDQENAGMIRERTEFAECTGDICRVTARDGDAKNLYLNGRASRRFRLKAIHFDRVYHQ